MLYIVRPDCRHSAETSQRLSAADGYLFFNLFKEALVEIEAITEDTESVRLARNRVLLHAGQYHEALIACDQEWTDRGVDMNFEFFVQRAFALKKVGATDKADSVFESASPNMRATGLLEYNLGCYEAKLGSLTAARALVTAACEINPKIKQNAKKDPDLQRLWQK